jgi:hypothetical protein
MNDDLTVHEMHYDKDGLNLKLGGQTAMVFLSALVDLFKVNGGKNFLTMTVHKDDIKYAITIQNCNGKDSPSEKLERYEKALKEIVSEPFGDSSCNEIATKYEVIAEKALNS